MGTIMENDGNSRDNRTKIPRTVLMTPETEARFERARKELNLTQLELSQKSTVSLRTIRDLESGRRKSFSESTVLLLCRAMNLDVDQIIGERIRQVRKKESFFVLAGNRDHDHDCCRRIDIGICVWRI
jgi:DNA-binding XRE family transcriptional regulator